MNHFSIIEKDGLIISKNKIPNAIALPSIQNPKYLISLEEKNVFFFGLGMLGSRSFKAILAKKIFAMIYRCGIIKYLLKSNLIHIDKNSDLMVLINQHYNEVSGVNIYLGVVKNENFSLTLQVIKKNKQYYLRYPISSSSKKHAANELNNINYLQIKGLNLHIQQFDRVIPVNGNTLYAYEGISHSKTKSNLCHNKLKLLQNLTYTQHGLLNDNLFFQELNLSIRNILIQEAHALPQKLKDIYDETTELIASFFIRKAFFHGDFSPDNILISNRKFYLIDFEYSCDDFFACFDLFHYLYKVKKFHQKIITLNEIKFIGIYVKKAYGDFPFFDKSQTEKLDMLRYLFIYYLFFLLKRFLLDEKINVKSTVIVNLQESIFLLFEKK